MKFILFTLFCISQLTHAIYPTGCKEKGYQCLMDENMEDKYYECSELYQGIRTCPSGTKCVQKERIEGVIPCETVKEDHKLKSKTGSQLGQSSLKTASTGSLQSPVDNNITECTVNGLFCIDDGEHDYQYYECSDNYQGFRPCAPGTKCNGEEGNPYDYNPCVIDPDAPVQPQSSEQSSEQTSSSGQKNETSSEGDPSTPSVGTDSSSGTTDINITECTVNGLFCIDDGEHDYQYYECSDNYQGFRPCAAGTKCNGEEGNPYEYNPCVIDPDAPIQPQSSEQSSEQTSSSSGQKNETSSEGDPTTPSVGTDSSTDSETSEYNITECKVNGLFCIDDGEHDYQYYECSDTYQGFRPCAAGTKCNGEEGNPYDYNPCITDPDAPIQPHSSEQSSEGDPSTPSVGTDSSTTSSTTEYNITECTVNGLFCIDDGEHDYQYYECSDNYQGFRPCAPGTKCNGEEGNPYDYNPCVVDPDTPVQPQSSEQSTEQSSEASSEGNPITPSVGTDSSTDSGTVPSTDSGTSSTTDYNITECKVNGLFCIDDGEHDYQYYECSDTYQGFRPCSPGTKCAGEEGNPYDYNPCITDPDAPIPSQSSSEEKNETSSEGDPSTPSVGTDSSTTSSTTEYNITECTVNGLFCIDDGEHDYQYYECSDNYQGFRPCAPGTKCNGEEGNPYDYNPCVVDPDAPVQPQSSEQTSSSEASSSEGDPSTPSVGTDSSTTSSASEYNITECKVNGLFCIDDGEHDYEYYECSDTYQGFRSCAAGTKCSGEEGNPYDYNPCITDPDAPIPTQSSESTSSEGNPTTPSVGTDSSTDSETSSTTDYNITECKVNGLFCIDDGEHDYEYYECSDTYQGFRPCSPGTKCNGEEGNPYDYNPCVIDPDAPVQPQSSEQSSEASSSEGDPSTPSVGTDSSTDSTASEYNITECKVNGLFCIDDGEHDYEYYECSDNYQGFRPCAPGTKCNGEEGNPYDYNPCVIDPDAPIQPQSSESTSSEGDPTTPSVGTDSSTDSETSEYNITECKVNGLFCIDDGEHDYQYYECSDTYQGFRPCAVGTKCSGEEGNPYDYNPCVIDPDAPVQPQSSEQSSEASSEGDPTTPSVGTDSSTDSGTVPSTTSSTTDYDVMECKVNGLFCVMDGNHDYQYYECADTFRGFRPCAPGTKCAGEQDEPYDYNPCITDPDAPIPSQSSSEKKNETSSEGDPTTPSVGTDSSTTSSASEYNITECKVNGLFCIDDGEHDYQYYECSDNYQGFRPCAPGTKCNGEEGNPYDYNPCITDPDAPIQPHSSEQSSSSGQKNETTSEGDPSTPSVGTDSSTDSTASEYNITECKVNGLFCVMDGKHDYQYYECSDNYKGFRECAPGTKCAGEQDEPYKYNPCVIDPNAPIQPQSSQATSSEGNPTTPSVGTDSSTDSETSSTTDYNITECKVNGLFCIDDGEHDYQYYECSDNYQGFRPCAAGTKCSGEEGNPYDYNPCVVDSETNTSSEGNPSTPSVGTSSEGDNSSSGDFVCPSYGIFCHIDDKNNDRYYECSQTFNGSRPCAPGTWCRGPQDTPYEYNPCVFIDQTTWFGREIRVLQ